MTWGVLLGAALAAGLPTMVYLGLVWWLDRYEKEPLQLLAITFLWGALPAALLALVLEVALALPLVALGDAASEWQRARLLAPAVEEVVKGLALVGLYSWRRHEFNGVLDGIIYGAFVGLGFALTENFLAFTATFADGGGLGLGVIIVSLRAVAFGLNHPLFSALFGAGLGWVRYRAAGPARGLIPALCLMAAIGLHLLHNALAVGFWGAWWAVPLAMVADWSGLGLIATLITLAWVAEHRWIREGLRDEVRLGHVTPDEYRLVISHRRRALAEWKALRAADWARYRAVSRHLQALTELAFARYHARERHGQLLTSRELAELRTSVRLGRLALAATAGRLLPEQR